MVGKTRMHCGPSTSSFACLVGVVLSVYFVIITFILILDWLALSKPDYRPDAMGAAESCMDSCQEEVECIHKKT